MKDENKTREQLIQELERLRHKNEDLFEARLEAEKKQEKVLQMAAKAANLASIGVIAGGITHEINQPLSAIQVHTNTLLYLVEEKKYKLPEPFTKIFNEISEGIQRINIIIQHMRSFWLSADSESLEDVDFNQTIKSALSLTNRKALSHSIKLKQELTPQRISIKANRFQVEQIVINLVINAINALDKKTSIQKEILLKTSISNGKAVLLIHDNGIGLPTEEYEKLFSPFFSTKKYDEGMGLGLAIVKMFVDRFKGEIEAGANEEGGATFTVRFPAENYSENTE
ncbi:MAG: GHKL domain-containing protein [candidate division Zixibacteria bacterium]|nr:GHKL domain-containing protein [Candidatus Tariuqbacter arcticus]